MKPKKSLLQKQETAKRKNRLHWSSHKDEIIRKRSYLRARITTSQLFGPNEGETHGSPMADDFDNLHIDETPQNTDARSYEEEESEDHHFGDCLDGFDECCADIRASDGRDGAGSDDVDERDN